MKKCQDFAHAGGGPRSHVFYAPQKTTTQQYMKGEIGLNPTPNDATSILKHNQAEH